MEESYKKLKLLIETYKKFKEESKATYISEETTRVWINDLLEIFGWDVHNTMQVLQEKEVGGSQREKLEEIESTHVKPDYTLVNGKAIKSYLDAKRADIDIFKNKKAAFQARSYGWSAGVPCVFLSNFEQLVIFDCQILPRRDLAVDVGTIQLTIDDYLDNFEVLNNHLNRICVYYNALEELYVIPKVEGCKTVDRYFNELLSNFRIELAKDLYLKNEALHLNDEELSYYVQIIIDRIIFIRVCETKGLEEKGLLRKFAKTDFWIRFKESCYTQFFKHYDGAMFSNSDSRFNKLKVDNQVFIKFINQLYYPYPYRFDAIPVKIIAKVYEGFLAYSLVVKDGKVSVELKAEYVKTNGIIPTDEKIAEAICDETIEENSIKDISDIWSIQVLDPCCGSGIFLIAAYEKLLNRLKELAIESDNDFCICNGDERFLTIAIKQKLMSSCLYGIDIDPIAVEVTKMSLALKVIDDADPTVYTEIGLFGDKILKDIDKNIVCGNTLVDTDIDIPVNEISIIKPTDIKSLFFANVFQNKGGFSYIIGNPPYVETKYFKATSLSMHKYLKTYYHSFQGKVDLSVIFVERCIDLLALNGKIGFIIQRRWFKTTYGKNARSFIAQKGYLNKLFDIGTTDLFPGRITYVSIMVLQKSICNDVEYAYIQGNRYDVLNYFAKESVRQIIPGNYFKEEIWAPEFYGISTIKNKYCKLGMLKNNRNIHVHGGIQVL